jgi:hypothetical protein
MTPDLQNAKRRDLHETTIRSVVDFAREVRIHLRDMQVIFGSVTETAARGTGSFRLRPWGVPRSIDIPFDDVVLASTVKQMGWERHRAIAVAQQSGVFTSIRKIDK